MDTETQPSHTGSNKMWYIIGAVVLVLLVGGWLVTQGLGGIAGTMSGVDTDRSMDGSTTYSNEEGSVTVGGSSMPENWPSDAPDNYSGATIQYAGTSNPQTGAAGSAVVYTVQASMQQVADHYKAEFQSNGWTIENTANIAGATVLTARKDTRVAGIYMTDAGSGSVSVTAGIEL